ncbi:MAG: tetratricopeptide repeat protein [Alphaproteobacteria bacterium]|nr:tetratricopeptide repeat protein [Alphaproteobacteria bacterium]
MTEDVARWLEDLGLEQYRELFAEQAIDLELLAELDDADLEKIGITALGHRKRLLKAAAELGELPTVAAEPGDEAERRQVTVLFADISGFTALSEQLGAEKTHALLSRFFAVCDAAVVRFGGAVDKHIGDAVMAVFGAPTAHTDDPERAVRAALELHRVSAELSPAISVHIGIASGQVVASRLGSATHTEYTVTGESVNLASRLTDLADPGETLASAAVARSLANRVDGTALGPRMIDGLPEPIEVWRIECMADDQAGVATRFVGRTGERKMFAEAMEHCLVVGSGETILVRGEAGIGKTRLLHEFDQMAEARGFASCSGLVLDFGTGKGQDAIASLVRGLLDVAAASGTEERAAAAERAIADGLLADERRPYLNDLLDLPQPDVLRSLFEAIDNETRNRGKQDTLAELVIRRSAQQPLLLRIEDLHWADASIFEHSAALAKIVSGCRALLILTSRMAGDPFDDSWRQRTDSAALRFFDLGPLGDAEAADLAQEFVDIEHGIVSNCVARAGGNPLFLEQLLRNADELAEDNIPGTVQGIVQARLDAIPAVDRRALQAASVLGQRFTLDEVRAIAGLSDYRPDRLLAAALVKPVSGGYLFGHALIRDGAYASLLTQRRYELHRAAADWFAGRDALLHATHLDEGGDPMAAAAYLAAGRDSAAEFRYDEALIAIARGAEIAEATGLTFELEQLRGDVLRDAGQTDASIEAFRAALATAPDEAARCRALIGIAAGLRVLGQAAEALTILDQAQPLATVQDLPLEQARIHQLRGNIAFINGDVDLCRTEQQQSLIHARVAGSAEIEAQAHTGLGDADYMQSHMISAYENFQRALAISDTHGLLATRAGLAPAVAHTLLFQNQLSAARRWIEEELILVQRVGHRRAELIARLNFGGLLCEFGEAELGLVEVETSLDAIHKIGATVWEPLAWSVRARCLALLDRPGEAIDPARRGAQMARESSRALLGPWCLGLLAFITDDEGERHSALEEGEAMLAGGVVGHCQLWFYRDAMEACLNACDIDAVERYADALEDFTRDEPLPWSDFFIARGRALVAHARNPDDASVHERIVALIETAERIAMGTALPALQRAAAGA